MLIEHTDLEIHHRKKESVSVNIQVLIDQVKSVLLAVITKNVVLLISVAQLHDLATNQIRNRPSNVDKSEAI